MFKRVFSVVFLLFCVWGCESTEILDLNGEWLVKNSTMRGSIPAVVPGSIYSALMAKGIIGDIYYRDNDIKLRWVGRSDWTFYRSFTVTGSLLDYQNVVLVCEGLDTVSSVYINDKKVGSSINMFVRYVYNIKDALKEGDNVITVEFTSPVTYSNEKARDYPYTVHPNCPHPAFQGECHANMIRKMQCSFSWDWGPSFPSQGIWRDIYVQAFDAAVIRDITVETSRLNLGWLLKVEAFTDVSKNHPVKGQMQAIFTHLSLTSVQNVYLTKLANSVQFFIEIVKESDVETWWPRGYGKQTLYPLTVTYLDENGQQLSSKTIRFGFRTVQLVQDFVSKTESDGRTYYFRVNDMPIFLKGSNWIPADILPERATRERIHNLLQSAADANMNTIRIWGGGIYESDDFYELCDELGILVWQDFMFACALYPTDAEFLGTVREEITYQIRRLKHHPCLLAYSGNNENEGAIVGGWWPLYSNLTRYKADYVTLYIDTVYDIVKKEDPHLPFMPSSPSNGLQTEAEGWISRSASGTRYGDIHFYQYSGPFFSPFLYKVPRMASEYGLQSLPSLETLQPVLTSSDLNYDGRINSLRQHHPGGNPEIMNQIRLFMKEPNSSNKTQLFEDIIYCTQIDQAIGMKTETEHYRRWQNRLNVRGEGNTMGALYWMLNDIWQAPTWSSLEYGGKWKMLHYYAARFFAPTLVSPVLEGSMIDVYIVLDEIPLKEYRHLETLELHMIPKGRPKHFSMFKIQSLEKQAKMSVDFLKDTLDGKDTEKLFGLEENLYIKVYSWSKMEPLYTEVVPFQLKTSSGSVYRTNIDQLIQKAKCPTIHYCFLYFHLGDPDDGPTNWLMPGTFKEAQGLQKAHIKIADVGATNDPHQLAVTIETDNIAPFVWLEAYGVKGRFSDNGFLMVEFRKTLIFYSWGSVNTETLRSSLRIKSLMDIYY